MEKTSDYHLPFAHDVVLSKSKVGAFDIPMRYFSSSLMTSEA